MPLDLLYRICCLLEIMCACTHRQITFVKSEIFWVLLSTLSIFVFFKSLEKITNSIERLATDVFLYYSTHRNELKVAQPSSKPTAKAEHRSKFIKSVTHQLRLGMFLTTDSRNHIILSSYIYFQLYSIAMCNTTQLISDYIHNSTERISTDL